MMAPIHFRNARMSAPHHIIAKITEREGCRIRVRVSRVFRGHLTCGSMLTLSVSILPHHPLPLGSTLYVEEAVVKKARYVEAFLNGDPPDVVMDQIKFFRRRFWLRAGDPSQEHFLW